MNLDTNGITNRDIKKMEICRAIFNHTNTDYIDIIDAIKILKDFDSLPVEIPITNNMVFIGDLAIFLVDRDLEPYVCE